MNYRQATEINIDSTCREVWNAFLENEGLIVASYQYLDIDPSIGPVGYNDGDYCPNKRFLCDFSDGTHAKIRLLQDQIIGDEETFEIGSADDYQSFRSLFNSFINNGGRIGDCILCISGGDAMSANSACKTKDLSDTSLLRRFRTIEKTNLPIVIAIDLGCCGDYGILESISAPDTNESEISTLTSFDSAWSKEVVKVCTIFCEQLMENLGDLAVENPSNFEVLINNMPAQESDFFASTSLYQADDSLFAIGDSTWLPLREVVKLINSESDQRDNFLRSVAYSDLTRILFRASSQADLITGPMGIEYSESVSIFMDIFQCSAFEPNQYIVIRQGFDCGEFDTGVFSDEGSSEYIYRLSTLNRTIWQGVVF